MKLLLDEHFSQHIAAALREPGHDAIAVAELVGLRGSSDEAVLDWSGEGRCVVTANIQDFRPLAASRLLAGDPHPGLILVPNRKLTARVHAGSLIDLLADVCADNPSDEDIKSREIWLAPPA